MAVRFMERLRQEELSLSEAERAELARDLVKSLDGPADASEAKGWDVEIARRIEQVDAGTAIAIDRDEFSRRAEHRVRRHSRRLNQRPFLEGCPADSPGGQERGTQGSFLGYGEGWKERQPATP